MKKLVFLITLIFLISPISTFAQSATDSAVRQAVKDKVEAIKTSVAKRAFVGTISAKSDATITITNLKNQPRTAVVTGNTTIKLTGGKEGTFADLKVGDFVISMGDVDSQNTLTAKRLLVITKPGADKRQAIFGRVTDTSASSLTIETLKKDTLTIKTTSSTTITSKIDGKVTKAKLSDIKVGDHVVTVGTPGTTTTAFTAKIIHAIPSSKP